ncbi:MAG: hypothetical protein PUJ82_07575, partial [Spirochaetales bacterium]|nr:hypothetical protein [Spirochaetales bacterium]MDY5914932.1 hypothetical protein [Treponema sp.]
ARRFLGYRNYYNAALAAAPKKVFLPCVSLPRANFYENIFYNAFALNLKSSLMNKIYRLLHTKK